MKFRSSHTIEGRELNYQRAPLPLRPLSENGDRKTG